MELDYDLIARARALTNGANVHSVRTWIFCYETSLPGSKHRDKFENLLRAFVGWKTQMRDLRQRATRLLSVSADICSRSAAINRKIEQLASRHSD